MARVRPDDRQSYEYTDASFTTDAVGYRPAAWSVPAADILQEEVATRQALSLRLQLGVKRTIDIVGAAALLILLAPLLVLAAIAIRLDSAGPICFNRPRSGKDGVPFVMYKLRTMHTDAEARLAELQHLNAGGVYMIKIQDDPRITRVGRFLRASSIDELPQLINVLKGEMSLIGPRPQSPNEVALYTDEQRRRLVVRPGITGLWQVRDRHNPSFERWMLWDFTYIDSWSLWLDLTIALRTLAMIVVDIGRIVLRPLRRR